MWLGGFHNHEASLRTKASVMWRMPHGTVVHNHSTQCYTKEKVKHRLLQSIEILEGRQPLGYKRGSP